MSKAFDQGPVVLGRQPGCDLILEYPVISRMHCQILEEGGNFFLVDLGSRNGVVVDGRNCGTEKTAVNDQLNFQIEPLRFELRVVGQVAVQPGREGSYETVVIPRAAPAAYEVKPNRDKTATLTPSAGIASASSASAAPSAGPVAARVETPPTPYAAPARPESLMKQISDLIVARVKSSQFPERFRAKMETVTGKSKTGSRSAFPMPAWIPQKMVVPASIAIIFAVGITIGLTIPRGAPAPHEIHQVQIPPPAPPAVTEVEKVEEPTPVAALPPPEQMPVIPEMNNPEVPQPTQYQPEPVNEGPRVATRHQAPSRPAKKYQAQNFPPPQQPSRPQQQYVDTTRQTIHPDFEDPLHQNGPLVHKAPTVIVMKGPRQSHNPSNGVGRVVGKNDPNGPQIQLRKAGPSHSLPAKERSIATASVGNVVNIKPAGGVEGLAPAAVMKTVNGRKGAIQQCYNQSLQGGADVSGYIDVQWKIEADGSVSAIRIQKNALGGGGNLATCLKSVVQKIQFPFSANRKTTMPIARFPFGSTRSAGSERP